jgi:hypothetical protein
MGGSGLLGGLMNFIIADPHTETPLDWWKHLVLGLGAAYMVPLFLNMISSGLINEIRGGNESPGDGSKLFVLAGFCLVAAVSSRAFIRSLSERVMREARNATKEAKEAKEQAVEAKNIVFDSSAELDIRESDATTDALKEQGRSLSPEERAVLTKMTKARFSLRSSYGLAKDTGLEEETVNTVLSSLMSQGLVGRALAPNGNPRWYATHHGRTVLARNTHESEPPDMGK